MNPLKQSDPVHVLHHDVGEHQVEALAQSPALRGRSRPDDVEALTLKRRADHGADMSLIIVDNQDARGFRGTHQNPSPGV